MLMASIDEKAPAAAARACVDVLRGAGVLVKQNRELIMRLIRAQLTQSDQNVAETLQELVAELSDMLTETSGSWQKETGVSVSDAAVEKSQLGAPSVTITEGRTAKRPCSHGSREPVIASFSSGITTGGAVTYVSGKPAVKSSARAGVLGSPELLRHIMAMLISQTSIPEGSVGQLGRLSLVCRLWRDIARCQVWWERIAKSAMPVLGVEGACVTQDMLAKAGGSYRGFMVQLGRSLLGTNRVIIHPGQCWARRLRLLFGVWHTDHETYILNGECRLGVVEQGGGPTLVGPHYHVKSHEAAFTAASYGAGNCAAVFQGGDDSLIMRVILLDSLSNSSAVLFDDRYVSVANVLGFSDDNSVLTVTSPAVAVESVAYGQSALRVRVGFQVKLQEGADDAGRPLPEEHMVWRADMDTFEMMWGDGDGQGPSKADLARFMYGALGL